jgi:LysM repeat protein
VVPGDTCFDIATHFNVTVGDLLIRNPNTCGQYLQVGTCFCIVPGAAALAGPSFPAVGVAVTTIKCNGRVDIVNNDSDCWSVAQANDISLSMLMSANTQNMCEKLEVGEPICIPDSHDAYY